LFVLVVALAVPRALLGTPPEAHDLKGEVITEQNKPIAGASCTLTGNLLPDVGITVLASERGEFVFTGLLAGNYDLRCAALGYLAILRKGIEVTEALAPFVQVVLPEEVVVRKQIQVTAQAPKVAQEITAPPATLAAGQLLALPLVEQKFKAALPLIPGVVRTPDGRISIKGAVENLGMLLVDSAETVDPVTGSFSIEVPIDAVESVNVYKTAYRAEYGRFSGGLTSVHTKAPLDHWNFALNDFLPSPRIKSGQIVGIGDDSPRLSFTGPLWKDKLNFSEYFIYDLNKQPVRGLAWPKNEIKKQGLNSFTELDYILSAQHLVSANLKLFPYRKQFEDINSLIPQPASSDYGQSGYSLGATDRYLFTSGGILTTLFQQTDFSSYAHGQGAQDMLITPNGWGGNFFNAWTRESQQQEFLQNFQFPRTEWHGRHEVKLGGDFVHRSYRGTSRSHPVRLLRPDGTLAEQIDFQAPASLAAEDTELAMFAQDHWAFNDQFALEYGTRFSGQTIGDRATVAPRLGLVYSPGRQGKTILRSGVGLFYDRVPLLAGDFTENPVRMVTQFDTHGNPLGPPLVFHNAYEKVSEKGIVVPSGHRLDSTPYNLTWNAELDQELRPDVIARVSYLSSRTYNVFTINPLPLAPSGPTLLLSNTGGSRYNELETTLRVRRRERADFNISYVQSLARGDLNTLSSIYIPFEQPVIRPNFFGTLPTNVPSRFVTWWRFKVPWKINASPVLDVHNGFPYSTVDVLQNYVGPPNSFRFPTFVSLDLQLTKDFHLRLLPAWIKKHLFRGELRMFNITNHGNFRDVYDNVSSPFFGHFAGFQHRFYDMSLDVVY
jgi:hypothetical protein